MFPVLMVPAYRYGRQTPWGGTALRDIFGQPIPDTHTGEALELSVIPGLNSTDQEGRTLEELIRIYGQELVGTKVGQPFPLLIKLLDARERLSVQVHPDNAYAAEKEGKLGKTEVWVVLRAEPGARIVYGIRPGTTLAELKSASEKGKAVESLLHYQPVQEGEVYFIPSGTVHAIGAGLILYELQQSSDVTYRFYDWDRVDEQGNRRELHLEKALDVTNLQFEPKPSVASVIENGPHGLWERLLDEKYFGLDRYRNCRKMVLTPDVRRFSILTAVEAGSIACGGRTYETPAGQSVLIPAICGPVELTGGYFLNAYPTV